MTVQEEMTVWFDEFDYSYKIQLNQSYEPWTTIHIIPAN